MAAQKHLVKRKVSLFCKLLNTSRNVFQRVGVLQYVNSFHDCVCIRVSDVRRDDPSLLLVLKWGGELTPAGRVQAEELGRAFRCMYPGGQGAATETSIASL